MYFESSNLRDAANKFAQQTKDFVNATNSEAQDHANKLTKYVRAHYPDVLSQAKGLANRGAQQSRDVLHSAGHSVYGVAHGVCSSMKRAESLALKLGVGYVAVRLFSSPENKLAECTEKMKNRVQEKPMESTLIALGAGYLLGKILR